MDLIKKGQHLPATLEELQTYIAVGKERLKARRAEIRAYEKIEIAETAKQAILNNAQNEADSLLDAEAKFGELLEAIKPKRSKQGSSQRTSLQTLPKNTTKKQSHNAQVISRNPEIVKQVKKEARKKDTLPTAAIVLKKVKRVILEEKKEEIEKQAIEEPVKPEIHKTACLAWLDSQPPCDLLLTDPPYMTDVDDIHKFSQSWLGVALDKVKPTGRAYIFIGAYPDEIAAYLQASADIDKTLSNILVWTYRNTLGPSPKYDYKLNWQAVLYFKGPEAPPLDCPIMKEQFSVQDINAPDGRMGDRYHTWQKPDEIAERFIRHSTRNGDTVYDCFAGTGTFLLSATNLGRVGIGCELDDGMLRIAEKRGCRIT